MIFKTINTKQRRERQYRDILPQTQHKHCFKLFFPCASKHILCILLLSGVFAPLAAVTPRWSVESKEFASTMTITAIVISNDIELSSDQIEIAAFHNNECRGSVLLQYGASVDRYIGFLMVYGNGSEFITLKVYNHVTGKEYIAENEPLTFIPDGIKGNPANPYIITANSMASEIVNAKAPFITTQLQDAVVDAGDDVTLTVAATSLDGGVLSWQWYNATSAVNSGGVPISGTVTVDFKVPTDVAGTYYFYVAVTNTIVDNGDGGIKTATAVSRAVTITVKTAVPVTSVTINKSTLTLPIGGTEQLTAIVLPANATNKAIAWNSANTAVATVSDDGTITAKTNGIVIITVVTLDGNKFANCMVTIDQPTSIEIPEESIATIYPNPTNGKVTLQFEAKGRHIVIISDTGGKRLLRQTYVDQTVQVDMSSYPSDVYFFTIEKDKQTKTLKVVKE